MHLRSFKVYSNLFLIFTISKQIPNNLRQTYIILQECAKRLMKQRYFVLYLYCTAFIDNSRK